MTGRGVALSVLVVFAVLATAWIALLRSLAPPAPTAGGAPSSVSGGGTTLTSDRIVLPDETAALPPGSDLIAAHCTACHSPEMILNQPMLNAEKWQATIDKMRGVYKAPIASADDAALIAALTALPTQRATAQ